MLDGQGLEVRSLVWIVSVQVDADNAPTHNAEIMLCIAIRF
jgi:hypothetical protein